MAPMIAVWDDHETANDSWVGGAQNHQGDKEGDWNHRRAASMQAYREWLPISDEPWKAYQIGTLATLYRTETRHLARTQQPNLTDVFKEANVDAALATYRDGVWQNPDATLLGSTQEYWLDRSFHSGARAGAWQIVGSGTILGRTVMPKNAADWLKPGTNRKTVTSFRNYIQAAKHDLPMWTDRWDGYPAARERLLRSAQSANADLVMLTGDSHNAWAYGLEQDEKPAGVEFSTHSITSGGEEAFYAADSATVARGYVDANAELKWANIQYRGYTMLEITPQKVTGEWLFLDTVHRPSAELAGTHRMHVMRGRKVFGS